MRGRNAWFCVLHSFYRYFCFQQGCELFQRAYQGLPFDFRQGAERTAESVRQGRWRIGQNGLPRGRHRNEDVATISRIALTIDQAFFFEPVDDPDDGTWAELNRAPDGFERARPQLGNCQKCHKLWRCDVVSDSQAFRMVLHALRDTADALQDTDRIIDGNKLGDVIHDREFSDIHVFCRVRHNNLTFSCFP